MSDDPQKHYHEASMSKMDVGVANDGCVILRITGPTGQKLRHQMLPAEFDMFMQIAADVQRESHEKAGA